LKKSLQELCEIYAEVELTSYPASESELDKVRKWRTEEAIVLESHPIVTSDGVQRIVLVSHQNQVTRDGQYFEKGEVVPAITRPVPPFDKLLDLEG